MKKIKVSEATNTQLNWLVAKCEGEDVVIGYDGRLRFPPAQFSDEETFHPTTDPQQMQPIIEREFISTSPGDWDVDRTPQVKNWTAWSLQTEMHGDAPFIYGPTMLVAAARCYVTSKLGEEVEVPEELT